MEHHPPVGNLRFQHFKKVPGDRFTLAVFIRRQKKPIGIFQLLLQIGNQTLFAFDRLILGGEALLDIDRHPLLRKIAYVPVGGYDLVGFGKEFRDRFRFCRRLDDD